MLLACASASPGSTASAPVTDGGPSSPSIAPDGSVVPPALSDAGADAHGAIAVDGKVVVDGVKSVARSSNVRVTLGDSLPIAPNADGTFHTMVSALPYDAVVTYKNANGQPFTLIYEGLTSLKPTFDAFGAATDPALARTGQLAVTVAGLTRVAGDQVSLRVSGEGPNAAVYGATTNLEARWSDGAASKRVTVYATWTKRLGASDVESYLGYGSAQVTAVHEGTASVTVNIEPISDASVDVTATAPAGYGPASRTLYVTNGSDLVFSAERPLEATGTAHVRVPSSPVLTSVVDVGCPLGATSSGWGFATTAPFTSAPPTPIVLTVPEPPTFTFPVRGETIDASTTLRWDRHGGSGISRVRLYTSGGTPTIIMWTAKDTANVLARATIPPTNDARAGIAIESFASIDDLVTLPSRHGPPPLGSAGTFSESAPLPIKVK